MNIPLSESQALSGSDQIGPGQRARSIKQVGESNVGMWSWEWRYLLCGVRERERQQCSDYDNWMESLIKYLWIQFKFKICNFYQVTRYSKFLLRCLDKDTVGDNSAVPGLGTICPWHMISSWCSIFVWLHICLGKILNLSRRTARHGKWAESRQWPRPSVSSGIRELDSKLVHNCIYCMIYLQIYCSTDKIFYIWLNRYLWL